MTFLGNHTVAEARALLADVDHRFTVDDGVFQQLQPRLVGANAHLVNDWLLLKNRWGTDRNALNVKLTALNVMNPLPADSVMAEPEYQQILGYVEKDTGDPNFHPNDSIRGIELQFEKIQGTPIDIDTGRPSLQGPPVPDPDEEFLKNQTIAAAANAGGAIVSAATNPADKTLRNIGIGVAAFLLAILGIKILK